MCHLASVREPVLVLVQEPELAQEPELVLVLALQPSYSLLRM